MSRDTEDVIASNVRDRTPTSSRPAVPVVTVRSPAATRDAAAVSRRTGSTVRRPSTRASALTTAIAASPVASSEARACRCAASATSAGRVTARTATGRPSYAVTDRKWTVGSCPSAATVRPSCGSPEPTCARAAIRATAASSLADRLLAVTRPSSSSARRKSPASPTLPTYASSTRTP